MRIDYTIQPRKIGLILGGIACLLALLSLASEYLVEVVLVEEVDSLRVLALDLFSVNLEESIPTWYSVLNLLIAAALLAVIAKSKVEGRDRFGWHWAGLAVFFLYLSMDEGAAIHEIFADPLQQAFDAGGFFTFGWQILAIPLVAVFGLVYLRFLFHLSRRFRVLFVTAAALYTGGALIIEGISANQWAVDGGISMTYLSIATVEEWFEMLGVVVFIYALLCYIREMGIVVVLGSGAAANMEGEAAQAPGAAMSNDVAVETEGELPRLLRPSLLLIALLIGTNLALLSWIVANRTPAESEPEVVTEAPFYQPISEELAADDVLVLEMPGTYGPQNTLLRQITASLLAAYDEVVVVMIPPDDSSVIFAGDGLPFDRDSLTELLQADGQFEFVIFETAVVRAISAAAGSG